jgi:Zn finger protein HypA/HybF involved in hydrogenase expression
MNASDAFASLQCRYCKKFFKRQSGEYRCADSGGNDEDTDDVNRLKLRTSITLTLLV